MVNVIIPAAGLATRMRPLSSNSSKAMIPVNGKPIIAHILDHILAFQNMGDIVIVQNHLKDIEAFVSKRYNNIKFVEQKNPQGPLHAIDVGRTALDNSNNSVLIWLGDTICYHSEFDFSKSFLGVHPVKDKERWCLAYETLDGIVYYDKPTDNDSVPTDLSLIGIYHFNDGKKFDRDITEAMSMPKLKNEYQISSLLSVYKDFKLITCTEWYDAGELITFYETKASLLNRLSRDFNYIKVDTKFNILTKSSLGDKAKKIEAEKNWFNTLSEKQSIFVPRQFKSEFGEMKMAWETGTPLNEIFLYENLSKDTWVTIIDKLWEIIDTVFHVREIDCNTDLLNDQYMMYIHYPLSRVSSYDFISNEDKELAMKFIKEVGFEFVKNPMIVDRIHGDLHFGNIIFEPFNGSIKLLDPRGKWGNTVTPLGDRRYDYSKMLHDWVGSYISINSGHFSLNCEDDRYIGSLFKQKIKDKLGEEHLRLIEHHSIILILTCIPFHADNKNKQIKFLTRAMSYIKEYYVQKSK